MERLTREFYTRDALTVAQELLGKVLVHRLEGQTLAGRIVEAEAYQGPEDRAAHSYAGRRTARTEVMFGPGGFAYVYHIYGMHCCMNVVASTTGKPQAVLLRAVEPAPSWGGLLREAAGPGKLCQALSITRGCYGLDLCGDTLYLLDDGFRPASVAQSRRIGIDYAGEARDYPWRFYLPGNPHVSGGKRFRSHF